MKALMEDIEKNLAAITTVLASIRNPTIPDVSKARMLFCARLSIESSRLMVFISLESILTAEWHGSNSRVLSHQSADEQTKNVSNYWARSPISRGVIDRSLELGILNKTEKSLLIKQYSWDFHTDSDSARFIDELEREVRCIESIISRCSAVQSVEERPAPALEYSRSLKAEPPNYDVNDVAVSTALEMQFKGSLECEIDGTLGKILVFRSPPNTYPKRIAVKTIDPSRVKSPASLGAIERFTHELRHWIKYRHNPLIVTPFFTAIVYGWPYIAMPYRECTLRHYIDQAVPRRGRAEAVALMVQFVTALEYAIQCGLLAHQDLKPENILLQDIQKSFRMGKDYPFIWRAQLADFGNANGYAELNVPWGSRPYQAPEQYGQNADLSKVDVFACGVILHELLTGVHPIGLVTSDVWPEPRTGQSRQWKHENKWKSWAQSTEKLSSEAASPLGDFRHVIQECLRIDSRERPSISELQSELLGILKRLDDTSYKNLVLLLAHFHLLAVYSAALEHDQDIDRYQQKYLEELTL
ncbi:MAG: protein kinase [Thermodesulfobacteriota bacterium]|nr:protein kinase [Thermodesulfobacteriota bacterium]